MPYLYSSMLEYGKQDLVPMHMPGHKRNPAFSMANPYSFDVTEVPGTDDLHHAEGIIANSMERTAKIFGAEETHYLINGSTGGILSAIHGCTTFGGKVLMARNCHKSVYHAIALRQLDPTYLWPEVDERTGIMGAVTSASVRQELETEEHYQCVILVSPTYEGVVSDIQNIADVVHEYGIPLIVDEAHGAHLHFHDSFPESAVDAGADVVIQSTHKLLPALTQTGLIHLQGNIVKREMIRQALGIYQTSSPSYVLMSSIDQCTEFLQEQGVKLWDEYVKRLEHLDTCLSKMKRLRLYQHPQKEASKIVVDASNTSWSGKELADMLLERYGIQVEMAAGAYVIAMTSVADTQENLERVVHALLALDGEAKMNGEMKHFAMPRPLSREMLPWEAMEAKTDACDLEAMEGQVAGDSLYLYPPGIPIVVPGEVVTKEMVSYGKQQEKMGFEIYGSCRVVIERSR